MDVLLWLVGFVSEFWGGFIKVAGWLSRKWYRLFIGFGLGAALIWYWASPWPGATPQAGPGHYVPPPGTPAPQSQPSPATLPPTAPQSQPQVVLPPRSPPAVQVPAVQASAAPEFEGYEPPAVLPPLKKETPGVVRGWQGPRPDPYYRPH